MKIKNKLFFSIVIILNIISLNSQAVFDPVVNASILKQTAETLKQWKDQIALAKSELAAITGIRNISDALEELQNVKKNFEELKDEMTNISDILDKGFDNLNPETKQVFEKHGIGKSCTHKDDGFKQLCEGEIMYKIGNTTKQVKMVKDVQQTVRKLTQLAEEAKVAPDSKAALDYNNQIQATIGILQALEIQNNLRLQNEKRMMDIIDAKDAALFNERERKGLEKWGK